MRGLTFWLVIFHQLLFQGMFGIRNVTLRRKIGQPIRGKNIEARLSIIFFALFIAMAIGISAYPGAPGTFRVMSPSLSMGLGGFLLLISLFLSLAALIGLRDSWRVGVVDGQRTELITDGIYRLTRNPYFVSYLLMFFGYTLLLQNVILLVLSCIAFGFIHWMIRREESYLTEVHGERYLEYKRRVPRYLFF
ncbi:MAG: isoprenylcysteine carboxylmethyltransferase family protein [Calditrichaeota bacterium]|nr:isoprenylcysteine carboxylmethyltransferase family protein [Calditrichota bacterium]